MRPEEPVRYRNVWMSSLARDDEWHSMSTELGVCGYMCGNSVRVHMCKLRECGSS